jgi:NAD(P)H-dependent flavin oxidoreductase YrpB (nitropropane dioxygenase family)
MRTPLTEALGIKAPIIQAPMGGASCPALAAAVSNAGALGMLALSWSDAADIRRQIGETRALSGRPFGVNLVLARPQEERLAVCLDEGAGIVSFFWGDPTPFVERVHQAGALTLSTVSSADEARRAIDAGVDVVVAQGWEAGGHVRGEVATLPLVRAVVRVAGRVPVVAAGGIADGAALAAVLALGAAGAWIGTRFLASEEAPIHPLYRQHLFAARETDTVHTEIFDGGWPDAPHRVLRNATFEAWVASGRPPPGERPGEGDVVAASAGGAPLRRYQSATPRAGDTGDIDALSLWAGQGVGLVRKVQPAGDIVREVAEEARAAIRDLAQTCVPSPLAGEGAPEGGG